VLCNRRGRPERALLAAVFALSAGMLDQGSTGTARADIYAFIFSQKGLMAGLGLQGNKITRITKP
jgi:lipid-binding SYLF domain-containing protein